MNLLDSRGLECRGYECVYSRYIILMHEGTLRGSLGSCWDGWKYILREGYIDIYICVCLDFTYLFRLKAYFCVPCLICGDLVIIIICILLLRLYVRLYTPVVWRGIVCR